MSQPQNLTFECSLDGVAFAPCTSPVSYTGLSRTLHTFAVQATDQAGNTDQTPASRNWTIEKIAQTITVTQHARRPLPSTTFTVAATGGASGKPVVIRRHGHLHGDL